MRGIIQYLKGAGYSVPDEAIYGYIDLWMQWYRGMVPRVHEYKQYNGKKNVKRTRKTLGTAKTVCEDWANLCLNEKVEIVIDGEHEGTKIHEVLEANNFRVRGNQLVELVFALGTGAFVEFFDGDDLKIDYVRAGMIYPLRWDNGRIIDCAFASEQAEGNKKYIHLNIHELLPGGYVITNQIFLRQGENLTPVELPDDIRPEYVTHSDTPMFQIFKPNVVNNLDPDSPMGISIYANALDQLEGTDLIYDSYLNEFRLGKKRLVVPVTFARQQMDEDGAVRPIFDDNDTEFYALNMGDDSERLREVNMTIRHDAHEAGLNKALDLVSFKCGMGTSRYSFDKGTRVSTKTATEVISEKSDLYQNLKKHELILESSLRNLIYAIAECVGQTVEEVQINFDDSIIEDTASQRAADLQEVRDGIMTKWEYRVRYYGEDEETAKAMAAEASGETEETIDLFGGV